MEKLDYLRWYIGDTRIRNSKGYLINVNPYSENSKCFFVFRFFMDQMRRMFIRWVM